MLDRPPVGQHVGVVCAGPPDSGRAELLAALVDLTGVPCERPAGTFLVVEHGSRPGSAAYVPGHRQPMAGREVPGGVGVGSIRPPRRVELTLPDPLLRHFTLVDTPYTDTLGPAGVRVVCEVVGRGGALLFVARTDRPLTSTDRDLLTEAVRTGAVVFVAITPGAGSEPPDLPAYRAMARAAVPALTSARWFTVDPDSGDVALLRRALVDWAAGEELRRVGDELLDASSDTPVFRVLRDVHDSDWTGRLRRRVRSGSQRARQNLALELANIHLRCVSGLLFGSGCPGLPEALDRELHALSLLTVAECDLVVDRALDDAAAEIFGGIPDGAVRRRLAVVVRRGFADHRIARDLDRVLLVTSTGGIANLVGLGALTALEACVSGVERRLLPPVGVALSGGCFQLWRNPANDDIGQARVWLQRVLREVELELAREVSRRLAAVELSLGAVLSDAIDHGILLA